MKNEIARLQEETKIRVSELQYQIDFQKNKETQTLSALQIKKNAFNKAEKDLDLMKKLIEVNANKT